MALSIDVARTPRGRPYLRLRSTGLISLDEAETLVAKLGPGGEYHDMRVLAFADPGSGHTSEARKRLPALRKQYLALAIVTDSMIARAVINLMIRITGDVGNVRMCRREDEALVYLDSFD